MTVMAIRTSGTNADLIADCAELGYLHDTDVVLDATYGKGNFWRKFEVGGLVTNDIDHTTAAYHHYDFRELPNSWTERFQVVVFDPDYKMQGTSSNKGPATLNAAYGMDREYRPVKDQMTLIWDGLIECWRVLKPGGFLLYKCMDQVVSGAVKWQALDANMVIERRGGNLVDWLMLMGHRAQPERTRKCSWCGAVPPLIDGCTHCDAMGRVPSPQQHACRNYSSLLVFRKGR